MFIIKEQLCKMGKRKADEELTRFVWKRNANYDISLLLEAFPFAFNNQKPKWEEIAEALRDSSYQMNVTGRSCRERVTELLKNHRKNELSSIRS